MYMVYIMCLYVRLEFGEAFWFGLVRLSAKFKTSRLFPCGIFWCGSCSSCCCSSCDRGKTKSTPSPRLKSGLGTGV